MKHLWSIGIRSNAYKLFESYLSNRFLIVVANGECSNKMSIHSGVPQGAIWSPLLFDIFVRKVPNRVKHALSLFYADDLTLIREIETGKREKTNSELEDDLERLVGFGKEWLLEFEVLKTQSLMITRKRNREFPRIKMGDVMLEEEESLKVLGFIVDKRGNWAAHTTTVAAEARKRLGAIERIKHYLDDQGIITAYKAFVRSKMEYGNIVYWGAADTHLDKLDKIQNAAKKLIKSHVKKDIPSLEDRRKAAAVGLTCKLLDGKGRGKLQEMKPMPQSKNIRRSRRISGSSHSFKFQNQSKPKSLEVFKRSFRGRIPEIWNNIKDRSLSNKSPTVEFQKIRKKIQRNIAS